MLDLRGTFDYVWLKSDLTKIVRTNGPYIYFVRELVDFDFFFFHLLLDKTYNSLGFRWLVLAVGFVGKGKLNFR